MTEKPPSDFDFGIAKGLLGLAAFFAAVFVYIWRALGSPYRNVDDLKTRIKRLEEFRERMELERAVDQRFEELERRHRPEGD